MNAESRKRRLSLIEYLVKEEKGKNKKIFGILVVYTFKDFDISDGLILPSSLVVNCSNSE